MSCAALKVLPCKDGNVRSNESENRMVRQPGFLDDSCLGGGGGVFLSNIDY